MRICSIEGCGGAHEAKGWCAKHYKRWAVHGDPLISLIKHTKSGAPMAFILANVGFDGDECLVWPFNRDKKSGIPQISLDGTTKSPARVMCEKVNGPPPTPKHEAAHSCGKSHLGCVHPKHVRWLTHRENEADKKAHGTAPIGTAHGHAKITDEIVREIITSKESLTKIGAKFGISYGTAGKIRRREIWKHVL